MGHVICVANCSRQSGKTSTAVNFSASLAVLEKKTLLVDCDPAGMASDHLVKDKDCVAFGLVDVLTGLVSARSAVSKTPLEYLDVISTGDGLETAETMLTMNSEKDKILSIIIQKFKDDYDYIVFDTPSAKGFLARSAILAGDSLMIPSGHEVGQTEGIFETMAYSGSLRPVSKNPLKLSGIFFMGCCDMAGAESFQSDNRIRDLKKAFFPVTVPFIPPDGNPWAPACLKDMKSLYSEAFLDLCYEFLYREKK